MSEALKAFAADGFVGTTTAAVARRAGVTQPLVHYHFHSKDNLWKAAAEYAFSQFAAHLGGETLPGDPDPATRLRAVLRRIVEFNGRHPALGRMVLMESSSGGERAQRLIERFLRPLHSAFRALIASGQASGQFKTHPVEHVVFLLNGAAVSIFQLAPIVREIYGVDVLAEDVIKRHADAVVDIVMGGLLAP